jgi:signal transduction histidine kinase/FixJ family two-component response regulator/HPt (histidine-containing phosphotransfer) domain-containing protein
MPIKKIGSVSIYIFAVCFLCCAIIAFDIIIYSITARTMKQQLVNKCFGIASAVATMLEENPEDYRKFRETLDTGSDYYIRTKSLLEKIRFGNLDSIAFLYVEVRVSEDEMMYLFDGEKEGTDTFAPPGLIEPLTITRRRAYDTRSPSRGDFLTTVWGTLMSAYAPIFDTRNGECIGLVGADVSIEQYEAIIRKTFVIIAAGITTIMIMGALIVWLSIARMRADRENIGKSKFLSAMSHEIRTPLNAILGLAEVELQFPIPEKTRPNLEKIYSSGILLLEIVNDILDISKIESGNFEIFPTEYDFPVMINDTIQLNIIRIGSKPIEFKLDIEETIPSKLCGDEVRVKQILNNLLSNAFKYTEAGEVYFSIGWEQEGNDAWLEFTVKDTGRGIKEQDLKKLFLEYTQLELAVNRKIEGTGLGLSITKRLVERMGGSIAAESEYGKGSIFRVRLPQGIADGKPTGVEAVENLRNFQFMEGRNRRKGGSFIRSWMPYGKTLVVDDFQTNLDVMSGLLMPYGLRVDTVSSGREAVEAIRKEEVRYDLVFMDHMMPEMDGMEAVRIIRNEIGSPYAQQVVIVALTANAIAGNREMFLAGGFNDFISKPIDIQQLNAVLNRWIRDRQSAAALQEADEQGKERRETGGGFDGGQPDPESEWLLEHPVEGIDFAATLAFYDNSGAACMAILKSFVAHTPSLLEKLAKDLETSPGDYLIAIHGLKGACNAIGAVETGTLAGELESGMKNGNTEMARARHGEVEEKARSLTEGLQRMLDAWEATRPSQEKEGREEPDRELLKRLSEATGTFNSNETEEVLGKLEQYRYETGEDLIRWLREQAENFDYDAMHQRLENLPDLSR